MNKLISIIIPTWNRAECLKLCLSRIENQALSELQVIVSDDGSRDHTKEVVESFHNLKILYIQDKNSGLPAVTRNRALKKASGELVAFCDSDDYWKSGKLEKQLHALKEHDVLAVCSNAYLDQTTKTYFNDQDRRLTTLDLLRVNSVICSSMVIDKKIIDECGGFSEAVEFKAAEDYLLWLKVSILTDIYYLHAPLIEYTTNSSNSVRIDQSKDEALRYQKILLELFKFSLEKNKIKTSLTIIYFFVKSKIKAFAGRFK